MNQILNERLRVGDVVQHFKREFLPPEQIGSPKYLYIIQSLAVNSETGETMVIYQALYDSRIIYVRPISSFVSEVDSEKYPSITQKYRFERLSMHKSEPTKFSCGTLLESSERN